MCSENQRIKLSSSSMINASKVTNIHLLPCEIQHNGEANVDKYFQCTVKDQDADQSPDQRRKEATFRGRILRGESLNVAEGYCGYILTEDRKPITEEEDRNFKVSNKFSKFTYWNLEDTPCLNDKIRKAMQWLDISSAIHRRVDVDTDSENNTPDTIR
ncbi:ribonuclease H2 subunit C-like [Dendronephthya gigantea]|uniref:ribonuclease H2 subunit C-like n=1 Tax=Dendronephthya gigantea TaxID=151771 RepID=UPI00106B5E90|nr:ribonuclease H2 subunit C-like [Dendronephthya gigantea]